MLIYEDKSKCNKMKRRTVLKDSNEGGLEISSDCRQNVSGQRHNKKVATKSAKIAAKLKILGKTITIQNYSNKKFRSTSN
jgi:hypothetical protein